MEEKDSRAGKWIAMHGDVAVELDALEPNVLEQLIRESLEDCLDADIFEQARKLEEEDQKVLSEQIGEYFEAQN